MRVVKTLAKQIELAKIGKLFQIINCGYVAVTPEHVVASQGQALKFYARVK